MPQPAKTPISVLGRCRSETSRRWSTTCSTAWRGRYDLMNDLMSGGLHRAWKDALVTAVNPPQEPTRPFALLDVAGGTGDIALRVIEAGGAARARRSCDINPDMLAVGRERAAERGLDDVVTFVGGQCRGAAVRRSQLRCR